MLSIFETILRSLFSGGLELFGFDISIISSSPDDFAPGTVQLIDEIIVTAVTPAATLVLTTLFLIELARIAFRVDGDSRAFTQIAAFTLVKFMIIKMAFEVAPTIIDGISGVAVWITKKAGKAAPMPSAVFEHQFQMLMGVIDNFNFLAKAIFFVFLFLAWVVRIGAVIITVAVIFVRFFKLLIYSAWAPMGIAFLANQDTRSFGIGYLRNVAATSIQVFVLVLALRFYSSIIMDFTLSAITVDEKSSAMSVIMQISGISIFMGVLLGLMALGSGRIASELFGA